jgi:hypothetical protein
MCTSSRPHPHSQTAWLKEAKADPSTSATMQADDDQPQAVAAASGCDSEDWKWKP